MTTEQKRIAIMREMDRLPVNEALTEIIESIGAVVVFKAVRLCFDWHIHSWGSVRKVNDLYYQLGLGEESQTEIDAYEGRWLDRQR